MHNYLATSLKFFFIACFLGMTFCLGIFLYILHNTHIDFSVLQHYNHANPSILLDIHGKEWARFQLDKREPIDYDQIPRHIINAFIAIEDRTFFSHIGLSWKGIIRSILYNLYYGRRAQGASTITQQLIRILFFDNKKTFSRKIKEQLYALALEQHYSKAQILQLYLNNVYFGCGIYGIEAACQRFWGKSAQQITINEAAILAGIVRSPGNYCPLLHPDSCQKRRSTVLHAMYEMKFISLEEYEQAQATALSIKEIDNTLYAPHLKETFRQWLEEFLGKEELYRDGFIIQTTLDLSLQQCAEQVFLHHCTSLRQELVPDIDGALMTIDVQSGEIRALIGGCHFHQSKFNRALKTKRQMGSEIKPLLFAAAIDAGISFAEVEVDEPIEILFNNQPWRPKNYNNRFDGPMTLAYALSHSNNIISIKTLLRIGTDPLIKLAEQCSIQGPLYPYPSLALGCIDVSLKEVIGMFNIFANHGIYVEPHYARWIKDRWGTKVWKYNEQKKRIISTRTAGKIAKVLMLGLQRLSRTTTKPWPQAEAISKTGTTNDSRTCWFTASTPNLTTAVYIGCDNNQSMGAEIYPLKTAFPIWLGLHNQLIYQQKKFLFDPSLQEIIIHSKTGQQLFDRQSAHAIAIFI